MATAKQHFSEKAAAKKYYPSVVSLVSNNAHLWQQRNSTLVKRQQQRSTTPLLSPVSHIASMLQRSAIKQQRLAYKWACQNRRNCLLFIYSYSLVCQCSSSSDQHVAYAMQCMCMKHYCFCHSISSIWNKCYACANYENYEYVMVLCKFEDSNTVRAGIHSISNASLIIMQYTTCTVIDS